MNELQAVLDGVESLWQLGEDAALATVVNVQGSAYRRPGARMLIAPGGVHRVGSVSGGCLEGDVARKAWLLTEKTAAILRYDSTADDDGLWGLGLGCRGVVDVLVERLSPGDPHIAFLRHCLSHREKGLVATVFQAGPSTDVRVGGRLLMSADGSVVSDRMSLSTHLPELVEDAIHCQGSGITAVAAYESSSGPVTVLLEVIEAPRSLVVCGAGWDALPLVAAAKAVGWHVTVIDRRATFATRQRFSQADVVIVCAPQETPDKVRLDPQTAVVVMSHHYPDDLHYLSAALQAEASYIGVLGPARRKDDLLADLLDREGLRPPQGQLDRIYGPVGLDIGGQNPAEIAASIVAEILAVGRGRTGGALRDRCDPIHEPVRALGRQLVAGDDPLHIG